MRYMLGRVDCCYLFVCREPIKFFSRSTRDAAGRLLCRSLPPRWVTKNFSACGVITARRARHASPGQKERSRAAAARLAAPRRAAPRLASPCSSARAHAPARPRSLRESEATLQASSEPGAKRSRLEPRTGSTTAAGGSAKALKGSASYNVK